MTIEARSLATFLVLRLAILGVPATLLGCAVTPADLARLDTRVYPGRSPSQVRHAIEITLKTQGFTIADETGGRIKTAPKLVSVSAQAAGKYSATAVDSSLAWVIDVTGTLDGARVYAEMHPSQGGRSLRPTDVTASYAEGLYGDLYREIDDNLGIVSRPVVASSMPHSTTAAASPRPSGTATANEPSSEVPSAAPTPDDAAAGSPSSLSDPVRTGGSLAGLLGYGFNDALQFGVGVRGGYTLPMRLYLGGMFMYHFGSSTSYSAGGVSGSSHVNVYYGGIEGGYDLGFASVLLRPYGGIGPAWIGASTESNVMAPATGPAVSSSASSSHIGFWFGGTLLYPVSEAVAIGGDVRILVLSDYNTLSLVFTSAYRF